MLMNTIPLTDSLHSSLAFLQVTIAAALVALLVVGHADAADPVDNITPRKLLAPSPAPAANCWAKQSSE